MRSLRSKLSNIITPLLKEGLSPAKLALTITLGISIGILPIVWGTTLLCALVAFVFRLNHAAIQGANYLSYPLQIALFLPFHLLGHRLFSTQPPLSGICLQSAFADPAATAATLAGSTLNAVGAWGLIVPPSAILIYYFLFIIIRKTNASRKIPDIPDK